MSNEIIRLDRVSFNYSDSEILKDISLTITKGERLAIIGGNGSGKTTVAKLMNGLLRPTLGAIFVDGESIQRERVARIARKVGYLFQNPGDQIFNKNVYSEVAYALRYFKWSHSDVERRVRTSAELCGITPLLYENPYNLPLTQRRFVAMASLIAIGTQCLILDEPTAGQDYDGLKQLKRVINTLKEYNTTVILISHNMEFIAEVVDRVVILNQKRVVADTPLTSAFANRELLKESGLEQPAIGELSDRLGLSPPAVTEEAFLFQTPVNEPV